jgi:2-polyprenyl-3-methyl-5-hydroxy-6-metoxy-1,4-benzoquinol methylase
MMLENRSFELELLDNEDINKLDLYLNLKELDFINRFLGGHQTILKGIKSFFKTSDSFSILEIGSGGGDNLRAIQNHFQKADLHGLDLKQDCIDFANKHSKNILFFQSDYRDCQQEYDLIFNSLFCHHFNDKQLVEVFKWMNLHSKKGFILGDLHRHWLAYFSIKFLTSIFSKSYLVKNDAPLSVKRGFKKAELVFLLNQAGIFEFEIKWIWAFRYLIIVKK